MAAIRYGIAGAAAILALSLHALTSSAAAPSAAGQPDADNSVGLPSGCTFDQPNACVARHFDAGTFARHTDANSVDHADAERDRHAGTIAARAERHPRRPRPAPDDRPAAGTVLPQLAAAGGTYRCQSLHAGGQLSDLLLRATVSMSGC